MVQKYFFYWQPNAQWLFVQKLYCYKLYCYKLYLISCTKRSLRGECSHVLAIDLAGDYSRLSIWLISQTWDRTGLTINISFVVHGQLANVFKELLWIKSLCRLQNPLIFESCRGWDNWDRPLRTLTL